MAKQVHSPARVSRIVPGKDLDAVEEFLARLPIEVRVESLPQRIAQDGRSVEVAGVDVVATDLGAYRLLVLRPGIGEPFQKVAEFIDAFAGRQMHPIITSCRRRV